MQQLPCWLDWPQQPHDPPPPAPTPRPRREPAQWRAMTDLEQRAALLLAFCRLPPASSTKRLARHMAAQAQADPPRITDRQAAYLWQFCWTFRRQIPDAEVTREAARRRAP